MGLAEWSVAGVCIDKWPVVSGQHKHASDGGPCQALGLGFVQASKTTQQQPGGQPFLITTRSSCPRARLEILKESTGFTARRDGGSIASSLMSFFIVRDGRQQGPYPLSSLSEMRRYAGLLETDQILLEGSPGPVSVAEYLRSQGVALPPPLPPSAPGPTAVPPLLPEAPQGRGPGEDLIAQVEAGGRYVVFSYCISVVILTFKRSSDVVFLQRDEDGAGLAIAYSALSGTLGWWGIPWGPIWTIAALISNARGGRDVTLEVLSAHLGPSTAQAILSRRQKPARAGWLMNSFRVSLVVGPLLLIYLMVRLVSAAAE